MIDDVVLFVWWGIDADEADVKTWQAFQDQIARALDEKVRFIEAQTEDQKNDILFRLDREGWKMERGGSGAFSRIIPCSRKIR